MCLYTEYMKNPKYKKTKKNGGVIPAITDSRATYVPIGCKRCIECMRERARNWGTRLHADIKDNKNGKFITLTFSDEEYSKIAEKFPKLEGYTLENAIATWALRHFLERWRRKFKKSVRHFMVTELGHNGTENIHLHGIIWTDESYRTIAERWQYGYIWPRYEKDYKRCYVNERTVNYIMKYITKVDVKHKQYISAVLTSAGIGANYPNSIEAQRHKYREGGETDDKFRDRKGLKRGLPIYWKNKFFSDEEREKLWLEKLDKMERWVLGQRVDISKGLEEYEKALEWARRDNRALGYGGEKLEWEEAEREKAQRKILQETRIARGKAKREAPADRSQGADRRRRIGSRISSNAGPEGTPALNDVKCENRTHGDGAKAPCKAMPDKKSGMPEKYKRVLINKTWYEIREDGIRAVKEE